MKLWGKQFTLEFIELLRSMEWMWNMGHQHYHTPAERQRGYAALVNKCREIDPTVTVYDVKRKLKSLRTNLKKMERRVLQQRRRGVEHTPSLFYYQPMSFLLTQTRLVGKYKIRSMEDDNLVTVHWSPTDGAVSHSQKSASESSNAEEDSQEMSPREEIEDGSLTRTTEVVDCEVFGQYVAAKLLSISNLQRIFLEKIINDSIYQAELGNLTSTTRLFKEEWCESSNTAYMVDLSQPEQITDEIQPMKEHSYVQEYSHKSKYGIQKDYRPNVASTVGENSKMSGPMSNHIYQYTDSSGTNQYILQRVETDFSYQNTVAGGNSVPTAVLGKINNEMNMVTPNSIDSKHSIQIGSHNGVITIGKVENMNTVRTGVIHNGVFSDVQRQGVIVQNTPVDREVKYVLKENADASILKNVQFADDDIVKMCEDDGITIICVETPQEV